MAYIPTRKIARLRERADRLEREGKAKCAEWERNRQDIAYVTQPAGRNRAFARQRQRVFDRYAKGSEMLSEARKLREKADSLERVGIPEKGDAERARQAKREQNDQTITVGSRVFDWIGGLGTVVKVNRKSYRVEYDAGFTWTEDKSRYTLVEESED